MEKQLWLDFDYDINAESTKKTVNLDDYFSLEEVLGSLIDNWFISWDFQEGNIPFTEINAALEKWWYETINVFQTSKDQKTNIIEAYFSVCKKMSTTWRILETMTKEKKINWIHYNDIQKIILENIQNGNLKIDSKDGNVPFSDIFRILENAWYEKIIWLQWSEDVNDIIKSAWKLACKNN